MSLSLIINIDEWMDHYSICKDKLVCSECSNQLNWNKTIAFKGYRGVEAEICNKCLHDGGGFRVVPIGETELEFWENLRPDNQK